MNLLTDDQRRNLLQNGETRHACRRAGQPEPDFFPVVKLSVPFSGATWLLTELYPDYPNIAFGLCDLGHRFPELGDVDLLDIATVRDAHGALVEPDLSFRAEKPLSAYTKRASRLSYIEASGGDHESQ
jgi:hypothetical protein